jgi:tRNA threonylcarbamoyladenosine biosynthesis protein TsaB
MQINLNHQNAVFLEDVHPLAINMIALAEKKYAQQQFEDVAYFEPFYLKEFFSTQAAGLEK